MEKVNLKDFRITPDITSVRKEEIDDETYFSPAYSGYVSNSRLKYIDPSIGGSPDQFKHPKYQKTESLKIGSVIHECLLQPESFELCPKVDKPGGEKISAVLDAIPLLLEQGLSLDEAAKQACLQSEYYINQLDSKVPKVKEAYEDLQKRLAALGPTTKTRRILSNSDWAKVNGCLESCYNNEKLMDTLHPKDVYGNPVESYCEDAYFMDYLITYKDKYARIPFKMKADNLTIDPVSKIITLNDLKTTSKNVNGFMDPGGSWEHYSYSRQMACYSQVLKYFYMKNRGISRQNGWTLKANMLVVETRPNYWSRVYYVTDKQLKEGLANFNQLMCRVAYCEMFGYDKEIEFE